MTSGESAAAERDDRQPRGVIARLFPGNRNVWLGALVVALVGLIALVRLTTAPVPVRTGTNSVAAFTVVAQAQPGEQFCVRDLQVPAGTNAVTVWLGLPDLGKPGARAAVVAGTLSAPGLERTVRLRSDDHVGSARTFPLGAEVPRLTRHAELCLRGTGSAVDLGGATVPAFPGRPATTVGGKPINPVDVSVQWFGPGEQTVLSALGTALERATTFKSARSGVVVMWLLLAGWLVVWYLVVRVAATADRRSKRALAARAWALAFFAGTAWAILMPPFFGADEPEHFAYVQHLAETGERPSPSRDAAPAYSEEEIFLLGALRHGSAISITTRPRWDDGWPAAFDRLDDQLNRANGGGYTETATGHGPLYYALAGIPYRVLRGSLDLPQLVVATRIANAAVAALVALIAVLVAAMLFPRARAAWWTAGVVAGLQPVASSIAGTVNNDTGVNVLAALAVLLLVDAWKRGPRAWPMAALGAVFIGLPLMKITGLALLPVIALSLLGILLRHRKLVPMLAMPGAVVASYALWVVVGAPLLGGEAGHLVYTHPAEPGAPPAEPVSMLLRADYLLQMFAPFVQLDGDHWIQALPVYSIYVERGWGGFGWFNVEIGENTLRAVGLLLAASWALAGAAAWRYREHWREWAGPVATLLLTIAAVISFVAYAYATKIGRPVLGEQGRYLFPALVPLAVIYASATLGFAKERWRELSVGVAVGVMPVLGLVMWLSALRDWYL